LTRKIDKTIIICDCCGKKITLDFENEDEHQIATKRARIKHIEILDKGYGSLFDGLNLKFDVCDDCLIKWFKEFRNNPINLT